LDVDKAREIIRMGNVLSDEIKFIVISFYIATIETQNALLKFLEEPAKNIKIILIVSASTSLIPTVESRLYKISQSIKDNNSADSLALKFLKTKKVERIKMQEIKDILDAEDQYAKEFDKKERKDRELADNFLLELEKEIYLKLKDVLESKENHNLKKQLLKNLNDLQDFKKYIKLTSSSPKTIFEYLSLSVKEF
jgi:DNA polymerase III delta prime subunit